MMKLVCGILFVPIIQVHVSAEFLEDVNLKTTEKLLSAAKTNGAAGSTYDKIYTEALSFKALKGSDSDSLFLNLYFSAPVF